MLRLFFFLIGFGLATIGSVYIIAYLNYLAIGYSFLEYLGLILSRFECLLAIIGVIIISIVILTKGDKYDLCI